MPMTPVKHGVSRGINPYVDDFAPHDEKPKALDIWNAAALQTIPGSIYQRIVMPDPDLPPAPQGWDPLDHLQGYEDYASQATQLQTPSDLAGWKARVDEERMNRAILQRSGFAGAGAELSMLAMDPTFLASIAVPEIGLARMARPARALVTAARGAAEAGVYEVGAQNLQETRTAGDALLSVGAGAVVGGVLGGIARRAKPSEVAALRESVQSDINVTMQSMGAAATERPTTLAAESLASGYKQVSAAISKVPLIHTDLDTVMASQSIRAKQVMQDLATIPAQLGKNAEGIATTQSVEVAIGRYQAILADMADLYRKNLSTVRKSLGMGEEEFGTAVSNAARNGDASAIKEVSEVARFWRSKIADPTKEAAQKLGLLGEDINVVGAVSYFTRRYNREQIRANQIAWRDTLMGWFSRTSDAAPVEISEAVNEVTKKILGMDVGQANFHVRIEASKAGPLKERTLDVPDELISQFLDNNPLRIAASYVNDIAPQIEMARRFGDIDMKEAISKVESEYNILRKKASESGDNKAMAALSKEEKEVKDSLLRVRDRVLGRASRISPESGEGERRAVMASRGWRNIVTSARLGATALTGGVMDATRIIVENGFLPTIQKLTQLVASPEFRALSKAQARRVGAAVEVALSRRVMAMYDGAITEGWTQKLSNSLYKYTGLNHLMDFNRTLACSLLEDRVLKVAAQLADGGKPKSFELSRLASLGLDENALREIASEVGQHGGEAGGVRVSGSADWGNKALADAYDNALLKESKIVVVEPGHADRVWWMDKETGKFIGQLKTFTLSAPARLASAPLSMIGTGNYSGAARFMGFMMAGGYLTHAIRQLLAGKQPTTDPASAANEAFTETGLAGIAPDILSPLARRAGFGESVRMADRNAASAFGGPALGSAIDAYDILYNRSHGGISASDLHAIRRMLPWQSAWMLRRGINAMEGELAESMGLKGADTASFVDRFVRTEAVLPANKRGGTGTGLPP